MPNHVSQDLWVRGDLNALNKFEEFAKEDSNLLSANKFIPYPEHLKRLDILAQTERLLGNYVKDGFNSGGYEWCCKHWNSKWGIYDVGLKNKSIKNKKSSFIKYRFKSAWNPPIPVIKAMSEQFPTLKFTLKYYERGVGFKGVFIVKGGEVIKDEYSEDYKGNRGG